MKPKNKFEAIISANRVREAPEIREPEPTKPSNSTPKGKGKRSDSEFTQISAYVRKTTHRDVKIALLQEGEQEFSDLIEILLIQWLDSRT